MRNRNTGVTLVELIVVMVIIATLSTIAIPAYRNYIIRANRTDAKAAVLSMAGALERCYTRFNSYEKVSATDCNVDITDAPSPDGHYLVTVTYPNSPIGFLVTAVPQAEQAKDTGCASFTIDETNTRKNSGPKPPSECWGR